MIVYINSIASEWQDVTTFGDVREYVLSGAKADLVLGTPKLMTHGSFDLDADDIAALRALQEQISRKVENAFAQSLVPNIQTASREDSEGQIGSGANPG